MRVSCIEIIEVGPRDGLQNQAQILATTDKIQLIEKLIAAGARRIEVASFVNPARVPQVADAEAVIAAVSPRPGLVRIGLVLNGKGLERALATDVEEIGIVAVATDGFGLHNQNQTTAQSVAMAYDAIVRAKADGRGAQVTIAVAFGCPFEGEVPLSRVVGMAEALARAGPHEIAIADTIGIAVPAQVATMIAALRKAIPDFPLRFHFHNTRGTGLANAARAVDAGVDRLDSSVGGIGGCPFAPGASGNIASEDLLYLLERSGYETGYELDAICRIAPWLAARLQLSGLPAMVSRVGAFPPAAGMGTAAWGR